MKADAAREYVETLELSEVDKNTLICSIIFACNKVNNGVANQQAYLKEWCDRSLKDIYFELPPKINGPVGSHIEGDCFNVTYPEADLAYMDPPYTPTVLYHNYYHIWDSIMMWDKPKTDLKSKRRIDRVKPKKTKANPNYNTSLDNNDWYGNAKQAFNNIMQKLQHVKHVMISYSSESIVSKQDLETLLSQYGTVKVYELDHNRMIMGSIGYSSKSNKVVKQQGKVKEYIFVVSK
jgi:adenine-specific DNA-methyltransferase